MCSEVGSDTLILNGEATEPPLKAVYPRAWPAGQIQPTTCFYKISFVGTQSHSSLYVWAAFVLCLGRPETGGNRDCAAWEALLTPDFTPYGKGIAGCPHYDQAVGQADAAHGGSATLGREQV